VRVGSPRRRRDIEGSKQQKGSTGRGWTRPKRAESGNDGRYERRSAVGELFHFGHSVWLVGGRWRRRATSFWQAGRLREARVCVDQMQIACEDDVGRGEQHRYGASQPVVGQLRKWRKGRCTMISETVWRATQSFLRPCPWPHPRYSSMPTPTCVPTTTSSPRPSTYSTNYVSRTAGLGRRRPPLTTHAPTLACTHRLMAYAGPCARTPRQRQGMRVYYY